ncbi:MAG TPA: ubiquinol-cytochrome c reductase iron-sulfur subunit [Caulobacteraceae bacterium]|nr:ubiquinol-cytochrome c reductase iron-sulfur subunit [Caulobacteraceae bacterium]
MVDSVAGSSAELPHDVPESSRRDFIHIAAIAAAAGGLAAIAWPFIDQMNPASDTLASSSIEYDISKVPLGQQVAILFRKQPLFVRHRTAAEIAAAVADDHAALRDPATDASRVKPGKSEWLVLIGVCTHLGCTPTFGGGQYRGWLCPCHGSVYDTSGRIRAGPAPKNLAVPDYAFLTDTRIKVG